MLLYFGKVQIFEVFDPQLFGVKHSKQSRFEVLLNQFLLCELRPFYLCPPVTHLFLLLCKFDGFPEVIQLHPVRFVRWEEYDTVMLKALPLDLILCSIAIFIIARFFNNYSLFVVV